MFVEKRNVASCKESTKLNQIQFYLLAYVYKEYQKDELFTAADVLLKVSKQGLYDQLVKDTGMKRLTKETIGQALNTARHKLPTVLSMEVVDNVLRHYKVVGDWDATSYEWENPPKEKKSRKTMTSTGRLTKLEVKVDELQMDVAGLKSSVAAMEEDLRKTREMMRKLMDRVSIILDGVGGKYSPPVSTRAASEVLVGDTFKRFGDEEIGERVRDD
jgi:uncharacterized coiled-coil protein SlyX